MGPPTVDQWPLFFTEFIPTQGRKDQHKEEDAMALHELSSIQAGRKVPQSFYHLAQSTDAALQPRS